MPAYLNLSLLYLERPVTAGFNENSLECNGLVMQPDNLIAGMMS